MDEKKVSANKKEGKAGSQKGVSRRKFLTAAAAGAAALGFPMVAKAQGPITMRWQSTWPTKDIFHEYALDFAKKVNDMTGGDLKIEVLPAGAVVPAFGLLDAVSKGTLDGGHGVFVYHYGKQNALALWGSSPAFGMDANMMLSWHKYGGGKELLAKIYSSIGANVVSFAYGPMTDPAARLVQEADHQGGGLQGHEVPHRRNLHRSVQRHGRGGERAARRRDRAGPGSRPAGRGGVQQRHLRPPARLPRCVEGLHAAELPPERRVVRDLVQQDQVRCAAGQDEGHHRTPWKRPRPTCRGRRSTAIRRTTSSCRPRTRSSSTRPPTRSCKSSSKSSTRSSAKKAAENPLFKEIVESQRAFAARTVSWDMDTNVSRRMAYNHYFGKKAPAKKG